MGLPSAAQGTTVSIAQGVHLQRGLMLALQLLHEMFPQLITCIEKRF